MDRDAGGESDFERFARALGEVISDHPEMGRAFEVLVAKREEDAATRFLKAADSCDPPCPPGKRCVFNPQSLKWSCWPP